MSAPHDNIVRKFEADIDIAHEMLPLWRRPKNEALYGLLATFDSHLVVHWLLEQREDRPRFAPAFAQQAKRRYEGFAQAVRWLLCSEPTCIPVPSADESLLSAAGEFIDHGSAYLAVSAFYVYYSRGLATVTTVDPAKRLVRFDLTPSFLKSTPLMGFAESVAAESNRPVSSDQLLGRAYRRFEQIPYRLRSGRIVLEDLEPLRSAEVKELMLWEMERDYLFSPDLDLQDFSMAELSQFWLALKTWSKCTSYIYLKLFKQRIPQHSCMPTQILPQAEFLSRMAALSDLNQSVVMKILERVTLDGRSKKPDIFLQPICCGGGSVGWSAHVVLLSCHQRNMLKLMSRTPEHENRAANLVSSRERPFLVSFGKMLQKHGWQFKVSTPLQKGKMRDVDLLAYNPRYPSEVLIVEGKTFLEVDEFNEIQAATRAMVAGQEQVRQRIAILKRMPLAQKHDLFKFVEWERMHDYYGIVLTPETEPSCDYDHADIPACALRTIEWRLRRGDWRRPERLWNSIRDRRWLEQITIADHQTQVIADIRFELPCVSF